MMLRFRDLSEVSCARGSSDEGCGASTAPMCSKVVRFWKHAPMTFRAGPLRHSSGLLAGSAPFLLFVSSSSLMPAAVGNQPASGRKRAGEP